MIQLTDRSDELLMSSFKIFDSNCFINIMCIVIFYFNDKVVINYHIKQTFRVVLGWAYRGLTGGFLLLQNFSVAISVSPHVCFILVLILISTSLR